MNHFKLLSLEEKYDINLQKLDKHYFTALAKYHPDKARNSDEKNHFLSISIDINKTYSTLKDDLKRAEYLLNIKGININNSESRNSLSSAKLKFIWNELEQLENIEELDKLEEFLVCKEKAKKDLITHLSQAFENKNLKEALDLTISLKYLTNLIENIKLKIKNGSNRN